MAVVEAALEAGLDVRTITEGLGYSRPEYLRRAVRGAGGEELLPLLRLRGTRGSHIEDDELIALLDSGMTASHICEVYRRHPKRLADQLRLKGDERYKNFMRLYYLDRAERRWNGKAQ